MTDDERIAVVRRVYAAIADKDIEALLEVSHPEHWRFDADTDAVTGASRYVGHDGVRRWFAAVSNFSDFATTPRDVVMHEGRVAVLATTGGRGEFGHEISILGLGLWDVGDDGLVRSIMGITDPARVTQLVSEIPFRR